MPQPIIKTSAEQPTDTDRAAVEADLQELPFREPLVDNYNSAVYEERPGETDTDTPQRIRAHVLANFAEGERVDRQWLAVTEAARRAVIASPAVRGVAAGFATEPVNELLPGQAVRQLAALDSRTARLAKLAGKKLGPVLGQKPVPEELLEPDLSHAPRLRRRENEVDRVAGWRQRDDPAVYRDRLADLGHRIKQTPGISDAERALVARRYRYARDIKMLGLTAELYDHPFGESVIKDGLVTHELPSGTKLVMTGAAFEAEPDLFDPSRWEGRTQVKDRVHRVRVGGKDYIMKERKTPRHTDVLKKGHRDGLTSAQEFEVAREFANMGTIEQDDISMRWEKPLGYAEFPDGYQFVLFESEPELRIEPHPFELAARILEVPDAYQAEFEEIREAAKQIYDEHNELLTSLGPDIDKVLEPDELSFKEFADLKATYLIQAAKDLMKDTELAHGYLSHDGGQGFKIHVGDGERPVLEIIGFDFEYYKPDPEEAAARRERMLAGNRNGENAEDYSYIVANQRDIMLAASYAMLERMGMSMPSPT